MLRAHRDRIWFLLKGGPAPVMVEQGNNTSVLMIAFAGRPANTMYSVHEFLSVTKFFGYSRIFLWDPNFLFFHLGIDRQRPNYPSLLAYLKEEIGRLAPDKVVCLGSSGGGYAAIVAGHELRADYVHAFSPTTTLDFSFRKMVGPPYRGPRLRLYMSKRPKREFFNLAQVLNRSNGKTKYFIHYGRDHAVDRYHAENISGLPGVVDIGYPFEGHAVAIFLAKRGFLTRALDITHQHKLVDLAKGHFAEELSINEPAEANEDNACSTVRNSRLPAESL